MSGSPRPGFPMEGIATSTAAAFEEGGGAGGEDVYHFFNATVNVYTDSTVTSGVVQSQLAEQSTETVRVRNGLNDAIAIGDRIVVMLGADGLGVLLVKLCV